MSTHDESTIREAFSRLTAAAWHQKDPERPKACFSIPANPERDADLILGAAIDELMALRPAPAEVARVTWRKEPPTMKEAHECPRWWFRGWLNCFKPMPANDRTDGVLLVLDPDPLGEGIYAAETPDEMGMEIETYTVDNCKGEWAPCVMPPC